MRLINRARAMFAITFLPVLLAGCDITPTSPVLDGNPKEAKQSSAHEMPPKGPPPSAQDDLEKASPESEQAKPKDGHAPEKGLEL